MLAAIVKALLAVPNCRVVTTLDRRQAESLQSLGQFEESLRVELIDHINDESMAFDRLSNESDATLVIAPETDGVLLQRVQRVQRIGGRSLNCLPQAIELCGDKLSLAEHLSANAISTIPSQVANLDVEPWGWLTSSCVLKLRDGAGSALTFPIPLGDNARWRQAVREFLASDAGDRAIIQPWVFGQALSVAALCHASGDIEVFPVARQHLQPESFQYHGGSIPASLPENAIAAIQDLVRATCAVAPGLRGYVGFDLLLPDADPARPIIVEINPRLTTSFVGYQQLCDSNIAERMLSMLLSDGPQPLSPLGWKRGSIQFAADGTSRFHAAIGRGP